MGAEGITHEVVALAVTGEIQVHPAGGMELHVLPETTDPSDVASSSTASDQIASRLSIKGIERSPKAVASAAMRCTAPPNSRSRQKSFRHGRTIIDCSERHLSSLDRIVSYPSEFKGQVD